MPRGVSEKRLQIFENALRSRELFLENAFNILRTHCGPARDFRKTPSIFWKRIAVPRAFSGKRLQYFENALRSREGFPKNPEGFPKNAFNILETHCGAARDFRKTPSIFSKSHGILRRVCWVRHGVSTKHLGSLDALISISLGPLHAKFLKLRHIILEGLAI